MNKSFTIGLILILTASSLIMAKPAFAQTSIPTPTVPQFTVELVGPSYTSPTIYYLNQSSGQVAAQLGYTMGYSNAVVTIKNQPFTSYFNASVGKEISFYYNIQIKAHNETDDWIDLYNPANYYPQPSADSDYTNISIPVETYQVGSITIPTGTQTDIQVEAMIGYIYTSFNVLAHPPGAVLSDGTVYAFVGETSSWSATQTVTVPANIPLSSTPAPSSSTSRLTPTPASVSSASYASLLLITTMTVVVIAVLLAIIIALLVYIRKRKPIIQVGEHLG